MSAQSRLGDQHLQYPVAALDIEAVRHNVTEMDRYCREKSVSIAPHAKTTMIDEVLALQLQQTSTWGLTVANAVQGRVAACLGADRILVANQLVESKDIAWVAEMANVGKTVLSLVDSVTGVRWLDAALDHESPASRHSVLLEVGYFGGRCGARSDADFDAVAEAVATSRHLVVRGVSGYEGMLGGTASADLDRVDDYLRRLASSAARLAERHGISGSGTILSAGGSAYFDRVLANCRPMASQLEATLLLRSGCYAIHDHGVYARTFPGVRGEGPDLCPAATVWARILSRPEEARAVAAVGKRNLPHDADLPTPLGVRYRDGHSAALPSKSRVVLLSDQHLHLEIPADSDLTVGDVVPLGISHPCGLFDRWRRITVVDRHKRLLGTVLPAF
ncbi:amino acid deaminase [Kribbella sancticallisti]|uniref:Amino acid deaminase n=1 Tax=Kribbella sancticallisti TaxID=460087 RepID=A0ABN2CRE8_9ACTN